MKNIIISLIIFVIALGLSYTMGISAGYTWQENPYIQLSIIAFGVQVLAFIPAAIMRTEKFYDLTGSLTYIACIAFVLINHSDMNMRAIITTGLVSIWALRLGSFLFLRIKKSGKDQRFDEIKLSPTSFFITWMLQGLWVSLTSLAAWSAIIFSSKLPTLGVIGWLGVGIWAFGFVFEVVADKQKSNFKANPDNQNKYISSGLWGRCRHPNYFGEIVLWTGIFIMSIEVLSGFAWISAVSPIFVYLLLTKISGVPLLTERAKKTWGDDPDWQQYFNNTPALFPKFKN